MRYEIEGGSLPALVIQLEQGEGLISESGGRTWIRGPIATDVKADGGLGGSIGRMFSGESSPFWNGIEFGFFRISGITAKATARSVILRPPAPKDKRTGHLITTRRKRVLDGHCQILAFGIYIHADTS